MPSIVFDFDTSTDAIHRLVADAKRPPRFSGIWLRLKRWLAGALA